ncbi:hypothetical protein NM688_g3821 [Phlebia brevispora]|uniref:Uncharacterized protein n=1 Tax=Phlebia brevispora TaxID=194682 RepID=A0ACC1T5C6_9APHY|nr:hypothetical protein NM688_g3821 [Phlebia brevispora]
MSSDEAAMSDVEVAPRKEQKKNKEKSKKKDKTRQPPVVVTEHGKNEGTDTDWAYKPPEGAVLATYEGQDEDFDWDALRNNQDVELWIVRVPEGVKPKHLEGLKLDAPSSSKTARTGSLTRKHTTYDVWSLGEDGDELVGAEETKNFTCILPRKRKSGKLFTAPEITTRHIVLSARPELPSSELPDAENADMSWSTQQNPPRPSYPAELLKHRFMPYGSLASAQGASDAIGVEQSAKAPAEDSVKNSADTVVASPTKRHKRRKDEEGNPKKSKKSKTAVE